MRLLQTLLAFVSGVIAAIMWRERQTAGDRARPASPAQPEPASPPPAPEPVVEQVEVPDPEQESRIAELEAELAEQRSLRTPEPGEAHPGVDAIRAARTRALELERQLLQQSDDGATRWFDVSPSADDLIEAAIEYLPQVAVRVQPDSIDPSDLWGVLGAMQEFAAASGGAWFEFDGDFARWCAESGHPHALDPDVPGTDEERPTFAVEAKVNRSGQMIVPTFVAIGEHRCYYVDDVAGETGRMHIVGLV
ncbi:MAG: hypothetical protein F4Y95_01255 [Chloroflexi bacterium]|nr:hypothetical protein [Chloroflexota bacterium]